MLIFANQRGSVTFMDYIARKKEKDDTKTDSDRRKSLFRIEYAWGFLILSF